MIFSLVYRKLRICKRKRFWVRTVKFLSGGETTEFDVIVDVVTLWTWYESIDGTIRLVETLLIECDFCDSMAK